MQTSCFLILNFIISINGGGGSDFLSSQILTSSEQISSLLFFRMCVSGSRHVNGFISSKSGITLLLLS